MAGSTRICVVDFIANFMAITTHVVQNLDTLGYLPPLRQGPRPRLFIYCLPAYLNVGSITRLHRLQKSGSMRRLVQESRLTVDDLVCPVLVGEGLDAPQPVAKMPGIKKIPPSMVRSEVRTIEKEGISAIMLFGIPSVKDKTGSSAYDKNGVVQNAIREARLASPGMVIMADVCMCQYTDTGHCGIYQKGGIDNDATIGYLGKIAATYAQAGADVVSPSAMMDGEITAIRSSLDEGGFTDVAIMSHTTKQHSSMYSPFRGAAQCAPQFGDRSAYQMPYTNARAAMRRTEVEVADGIDIIMIKPALMSLDILAEARRRFDLPVAAYNSSGECAMVQAAHLQGWLDRDAAMLEMLGAIKRAGADIIVSHFARDVARLQP